MNPVPVMARRRSDVAIQHSHSNSDGSRRTGTRAGATGGYGFNTLKTYSRSSARVWHSKHDFAAFGPTVRVV
jgi:hypothetical protein